MLHRIGAAGLILVAAIHVAYTALTSEGRRELRNLIPRKKDFIDLGYNLAYFLGRRRQRARFDRFSYLEKFDYWAVYWGVVVMISTGVLLWFQDQAMWVLPKLALDMAKEAHSDEALLAALAIIVWHFYNVHLNPDHFPMNWAWLTGRISLSKMAHDHPLEYERMVALTADPPVEPHFTPTSADAATE